MFRIYSCYLSGHFIFALRLNRGSQILSPFSGEGVKGTQKLLKCDSCIHGHLKTD